MTAELERDKKPDKRRQRAQQKEKCRDLRLEGWMGVSVVPGKAVAEDGEGPGGHEGPWGALEGMWNLFCWQQEAAGRFA